MKQYVKKRAGEKQYANPSDYVRSLIRDDQVKRDEERLEQMLIEGLKSGDSIPMTKQAWKELRADVHKEIQKSRKEYA